MVITLVETTIRLFDVFDAKILADLIPHEPLKPIAGVKDDRLIVVLFIGEDVKTVHRLAVGFCQWEGVASDFDKFPIFFHRPLASQWSLTKISCSYDNAQLCIVAIHLV